MMTTVAWFPTVVLTTRFLGAWLRAGEGIGWLAAGTMPNSLYRMPLVYLSLTCVFCYSCSYLFVVCVFLCSHWSLVDVPLIFFLSSRPLAGLATTCITGFVFSAIDPTYSSIRFDIFSP